MSNEFSDIRVKDNGKSGFTLLEVMIAIAIFGLIMLYVSQLMSQQFRLFNSASRQNDLEHNTRSAMMHIIDELRLHHSKWIAGSPPDNVRVFGETTSEFCLICTDQSGSVSPTTDIYSFSGSDPYSGYLIIIYFDRTRNELWYQEPTQRQLISDQIISLELTPSAGILDIELIAVDNIDPTITFTLVSSIRLL